MKITIIQQYTDKFTGVIHRPGEVLEVAEDRGRELIGKGKAEQVFEKEHKPVRKTKQLKAKIKTK